MNNKKLLIIAISPVGDGLSGGDRIFIELARYAAMQKIHTDIVTWKAGARMCNRTHLNTSPYLKYVNLHLDLLDTSSLAFSYFVRVWEGILWSLSYSLSNSSKCVIYSASDFWMDVIPSLILKIRYANVIWAGTFYLAAPNPFKGYNEGGKWCLPSAKGIIYWLMQLPIYWILRFFSQTIFVTSEPDVKRFPNQHKKSKVIVIKGGVDLQIVAKFQNQIGRVAKEYDAVFMGRFHPQKGVLEIIDIWKIVVKSIPNAKLIMIGDGSLMEYVKEKIQKYGLEKNIILTGYLLDGIKKYSIFAKSRIVVHPAIYDSGGMAAAEAMAWGLPGVSFDLEALKTYYPIGMLKSPLHNNKEFALIVIRLLSQKKLYISEKKKALKLINDYWDWEKRAKVALQILYE